MEENFWRNKKYGKGFKLNPREYVDLCIESILAVRWNPNISMQDFLLAKVVQVDQLESICYGLGYVHEKNKDGNESDYVKNLRELTEKVNVSKSLSDLQRQVNVSNAKLFLLLQAIKKNHFKRTLSFNELIVRGEI